jgi:hypothetical protein
MPIYTIPGVQNSADLPTICAVDSATGLVKANLILDANGKLLVNASMSDASGNLISSVSDGNGGRALEVALAATPFFTDANNSSAVQLAGSATFTGTVTNITNQPTAAINLFSDQPGTFTFSQYKDAAGLLPMGQPWVMSILANGSINFDIPIPGDYAKVTFQNTGASATTKFQLDIAYGNRPISSIPAKGANPINLNATPQYIKAAPGYLFSLFINNPTAAIAYVQFYDAASGVIAGSTVPLMEIMVLAGTPQPVPLASQGLNFTSGLAVTSTTTSRGAVASATGVTSSISYF